MLYKNIANGKGMTKDEEMTQPRLSEDKCGGKGRTPSNAFIDTRWCDADAKTRW